ncbi:MAG: nuclear transport factor 2 family protein [Hyphomicrobiaceae bacterium]
MSPRENAHLVLKILSVIEQRQLEQLRDFYHPDITFHWQPGLPYSGSFAGPEVARMSERFAATWLPLQPTEDTRRMDPEVLATGEDGRVVVNYKWRGLAPNGDRFETEVLADYQVRDGRLARAQMFYFDLPGMIAFLESARAGRAA